MSVSADHAVSGAALPPGDYLRYELDSRGWSIAEFAAMVGRPVQAMSEIVNNKKLITPQTALELAAATDTTAEAWLDIQTTYELSKAREEVGLDPRLKEIWLRGRLAAAVPLRELIARELVPDGDIDAQSRAVCALLRVKDPTEPSRYVRAAEMVSRPTEFGRAGVAWVACVERAADRVRTAPLDLEALRSLARSLATGCRSGEDLERLPARFARVGVRLVHVPAFKGCPIDGGAFVGNPATIAITARIPRLDAVLETLLHEAAHLTQRHPDSIDVDITAAPASHREEQTVQIARAWALPDEIEPPDEPTAESITELAEKFGVSPALILGRLQEAGVVGANQCRSLVPNIRPHLEAWTKPLAPLTPRTTTGPVTAQDVAAVAAGGFAAARARAGWTTVTSKEATQPKEMAPASLA